MKNFTLRHRAINGDTKPLTKWGIDSEYGILRDVLLGPPDYFSWLEASSFSKRSIRLGLAFNLEIAKKQHLEVRACFEDAGVKVHILKPDPKLVYQIFARDSSVMTPWGPIITQLGHWWRRGEYAPVINFYHDNDIPIFDMVTAGAFEGGDFHVVKPGTVLCGYSDTDRTSEAGLNQVKGWIEKEGWEMHTYKFDPFFVHADVFFAMLSENLAAMCIDVVEPELVEWVKSKGIEVITVPYKDAMNLGCNVVALGKDRVILPREANLLKEICEANGLYVYSPKVSMISKGGGSLHCMCQPLRRDSVNI